MSVGLGTIYYQAKQGEDPATAMVVERGQKGTAVMFEGVTYENALEWIQKVFKSSGKIIRLSGETTMPTGTPRAQPNVPKGSFK